MIWVKSSIIVITGQKSGVRRRIPKWKGAGAMVQTSSSSGTIQCVGPDQVKDIQSMIDDFHFLWSTYNQSGLINIVVSTISGCPNAWRGGARPCLGRCCWRSSWRRGWVKAGSDSWLAPGCCPSQVHAQSDSEMSKAHINHHSTENRISQNPFKSKVSFMTLPTSQQGFSDVKCTLYKDNVINSLALTPE